MKAKNQTPFQRFQALAGAIVRVPKSELDRKIQAERAKKNRRNSASGKGAK